MASLNFLRPGRVEAVLVREDQQVSPGVVLIRLEDRLARARLEEARAGLEVARLGLEQARRRPPEHQLRLAQQAAALTAATARLAAVSETVRHYRRLFERNLDTRERVAVAEAQATEMEALARAEADRLSELKLQDPAQDLRRAEADLRLQTARVQQAEEELKELTLTAPQTGTVLRILARPGDVVGPGGNPAIFFCPEGQRLVRFEVEQEFAGMIRPNQPAVISDDSAARACWRGRVRRVAGWFGPHRVVLQEPRPEREVRTVECVIEVEEGPSLLRIGQRVRVRIKLPPGPTE